MQLQIHICRRCIIKHKIKKCFVLRGKCTANESFTICTIIKASGALETGRFWLNMHSLPWKWCVSAFSWSLINLHFAFEFSVWVQPIYSFILFCCQCNDHDDESNERFTWDELNLVQLHESFSVKLVSDYIASTVYGTTSHQKSKAIRNAMLQTLCDCCYSSQGERLHAARENIMLILFCFFLRWLAKWRSLKMILISILCHVLENWKPINAYSISDTAYATWIIRKISFQLVFTTWQKQFHVLACQSLLVAQMVDAEWRSILLLSQI